MSTIDHYLAMDARLVAAGFPATSPWWLDTLRRFYDSGKRQLVLRVGRRGGKSSTLARLGVVEALAGGHSIPPGDLGIVAFVSVGRDEAAKRLRTVEAILRALGVAFKPLREGQGFELTDTSIGFQVFTASISGVSGPTVIMAICDEVSKWADADTGANPATEVLASLRPTMLTQPKAKLILSSSPLGTGDAHATAFDLGDTDLQTVAFAESWIANPTTTEEECRALANGEDRVFLREYAAIPQGDLTSAFDIDLVDAAVRPNPKVQWWGAYTMILDPSSLRNDAFTYCVIRWCWPATQTQRWVKHPPLNVETLQTIEYPPHPPFIEIVQLGAWEPPVKVTADQIGRQLVGLCKRLGVMAVHSDQRESFMWEAYFRSAGLAFLAHPWTAQSKEQAVSRLRGWLRDGQLILPKDEKLISELKRFGERITKSGNVTYAARTGHDDRVALLVTAAMADIENTLSASPLNRKQYRNFGPVLHPERY